jgi:serine/threonine protein phosphatase PrpC
MAIRIDACVAQHQGDRKEQQDRVAIFSHPKLRGTALAVVADGMGGHTGGALAAEQVVHTAKSNFDHFAPRDESAQHLLESSMHEAHTMIKASRFMNEKDPHSTVVMLLLQPDSIHWLHCGDSRLYQFHDGFPVTRTVDHIPTSLIWLQPGGLHRSRLWIILAGITC